MGDPISDDFANDREEVRVTIEFSTPPYRLEITSKSVVFAAVGGRHLDPDPDPDPTINHNLVFMHGTHGDHVALLGSIFNALVDIHVRAGIDTNKAVLSVNDTFNRAIALGMLNSIMKPDCNKLRDILHSGQIVIHEREDDEPK